jgi:predicted RNase H-like nuclease (RuvC/YqgF family)
MKNVLIVNTYLGDRCLHVKTLVIKMCLLVHKSEDHPTAHNPAYKELEGKIKILQNEIFDLRQKNEKLSEERKLLKFRFRRRTVWLMKIIDQLNAKLERRQRVQKKEHAQVQEI